MGADGLGVLVDQAVAEPLAGTVVEPFLKTERK